MDKPKGFILLPKSTRDLATNVSRAVQWAAWIKKNGGRWG